MGTEDAITVKFPGGPVYQRNADVSTFALSEYLHTRVLQLSAMLTMTYGNGDEESFHRYDTKVKEAYLWGCSMLAEECEELAHQLNERVHA